MPRYAVLWDVDRAPSRPVGLAVERRDGVRLYVPQHYAIPTHYRDPEPVLRPDGGEDVQEPGDDRYFDQVLARVSRLFGVGIRDSAECLGTTEVFDLLIQHVAKAQLDRGATYEPALVARQLLVHHRGKELDSPVKTGNGHASQRRTSVPQAA